MNKKSISLAVASAALAMCGTAFATPVVFSGQDIHNTNTLLANPNSDAAHNAFIASLSGVGTESFESFAPGSTPPINLTFPGAGTATLTGTGVTVNNGPDSGGRYAISGSQYIVLNTGNNFTVTFGSNVAAFGFYGIDLGDYGGTLSLTLTDKNNVVSSLAVPYVTGVGGSTNGSVNYFGFYDTTDQYKSIVFNNNQTASDTFGFDNLTIGSAQQVVPVGVPEPGTLALLSASVLGFGITARRRRKG